MSAALFGSVASLAQNLNDLERQVLDENPPASAAKPDDSRNDSSVSDSVAPPSEVSEIKKAREREPDRPNYELRALEQAIRGPREIPLDHILVVQNRYIRKEDRHEIAPLMVGLQIADSFRRQVQFGFSYTYHLTENFGLEVLHAMLIKNYATSLAGQIRSSTGLETDRLESVVSLGSSVQWTPFRSKAGTDNRIYYFEGYFLLGGGAALYENSMYGMAMYGVGFRSYISRNAILKAELRNYADFRGSVTDRLNILGGASLLIGGGK